MTWQAFLDLSSAGGTSLMLSWQVLPIGNVYRSLPQGLPLGDWKVMVRLVCGCGVWEFNCGWDWGLRRGRKKKRQVVTSSQMWKDKLCPSSHPREQRLAVHLKFSMSTLPGCFSSVEVRLSHLWSGFHISSFPRVFGNQVSFALKCII